MRLNLDKGTWKRVRLGDVIVRSRQQVDPTAGSVDRYVAGGHFVSGSPTVERWGDVNDGQMGSTFRYVFRPGQLLFVSARPYLRKAAIAQFEGVVADKTYVLDAIPENGLLQEFLPFVLLSESFCNFAVAEATGSMNPRLLWGAMQRFEFDLPSLDEQRKIADLLWAVERHQLMLQSQGSACDQVRSAAIEQFLSVAKTEKQKLEESAEITSGVTLGPARRSMAHTAPYLRVANVQRGRIDLAEVKEIGATPDEIASRGLKRGDILVVEGHASIDDIGRAAIWNLDNSPIFQNHLFRVRARGNYRPGFLLEVINSGSGRAYIKRVAKSTSGLNTINSTVLKAMPVSKISLDEQDRLLAGVAIIDTAREAIAEALVAAKRLRSSILNEIFGSAA